MATDSNTREIPLTQGKVALVDAADYEWLARWKWHAHKSSHGGLYAERNSSRTCGKQTTIQMHRMIMDAPKGTQVDHINHDPLDNRRANLRVCSHAENQRNRKPIKGKMSKYLGVYFDRKTGRWYARIYVRKQSISLGMYAAEDDAARAYDAAAILHHGAFANPNFPLPPPPAEGEA